MSDIDEAFIHAYATPGHSPPSDGPVLNKLALPASKRPREQAQPPLAGLHSGPHISMQTSSPTQEELTSPPQAPPEPETQSTAWALEPIPAPHFHVLRADQGTVEPQESMQATAQIDAQIVTTTPPVAPLTAAHPGPEESRARRPLSTFSAPAQPATTAFNPVFEVDAFRWPKIIDELLSSHASLLLPVAEQLLAVSEGGRSLVGIAGTRLGIGCTTVQMCLARLIADAGKAVALVDANFDQATLARDLGLDFESGWEDVLTGRMPLAECVVSSLQDRMALLPLTRPIAMAEELLASIQTSVTAGVLRYHYDVVLFNLGAAGQPPQQLAAQSVFEHCRLDASIIVADTAAQAAGETEQIDSLMSLLGATCLGVIGNSAA